MPALAASAQAEALALDSANMERGRSALQRWKRWATTTGGAGARRALVRIGPQPRSPRGSRDWRIRTPAASRRLVGAPIQRLQSSPLIAPCSAGTSPIRGSSCAVREPPRRAARWEADRLDLVFDSMDASLAAATSATAGHRGRTRAPCGRWTSSGRPGSCFSASRWASSPSGPPHAVLPARARVRLGPPPIRAPRCGLDDRRRKRGAPYGSSRALTLRHLNEQHPQLEEHVVQERASSAVRFPRVFSCSIASRSMPLLGQRELRLLAFCAVFGRAPPRGARGRSTQGQHQRVESRSGPFFSSLET